MESVRDGVPFPNEGKEWYPQIRFAHVVDGEPGIEAINANGGLAVAFDGLPKTPFHVAFCGSQHREFSIWTTESRYGFRTVPKIASNVIAVRFVNRGFIARQDGDRTEHFAGYDQALLVPFEAMREERMSAGFSSITVAIASESIIAACGALTGQPVYKAPLFHPAVSVDTVGLAALKATAISLGQRLAKDLDHHDLITPLMQEVFAYQLISAWPTLDGHVEKSVQDRSDKAIRIAIDFIEHNLARKITVSYIAQAAGLSVRSLQIGFKDRIGHSPVNYLIARRLDHVHAALQSNKGENVDSIAKQWGFTHMGDFGRRYRLRFGFSPSRGRQI